LSIGDGSLRMTISFQTLSIITYFDDADNRSWEQVSCTLSFHFTSVVKLM
jgi:hypothetical protein